MNLKTLGLFTALVVLPPLGAVEPRIPAATTANAATPAPAKATPALTKANPAAAKRIIDSGVTEMAPEAIANRSVPTAAAERVRR